ncbi:hypothetical protein [Methylocaldum sp. SAD2]|uniref:hypothetical protein n=1 Tax=Methylocaldum sp. GT1BB TaxID=3438963 RepID=UPI000A32714B
MKFYLSPALHGHRRGRFLANLLAAEPLPSLSLPNTGVLLMTGEQLQVAGDQQSEYTAWARQPGRISLLLPPYQEGRIISTLDWVCEFASNRPVAPEPHSVAHWIAQEVIYRIQGVDGSSDTDSGQWTDHSSHTRYWKAHSNSGLIAATVLPLWSVSLLDHADSVIAFLEALGRHAGKASAPVPSKIRPEDVLHPEDITVMVCCYGFGVATAPRLTDCLRNFTVPLLDLTQFDLPESFARLKLIGFLDDGGLTPEGLDYLQSSRYWAFAENLNGAA